MIYFVVRLMLWVALLKSGVHPTHVGVVTAFTIPARPRYDPTRFADLFDALVARYHDL